MSLEERREDLPVHRLKFLFLFFALLVLILAGKLATVQIVKGAEYRLQSEEKRLRIRPVSAPRGLIFDRHGQQIAANRTGFTISLVDMGSKNFKEVIRRTAEILEQDPDQIMDLVNRQRYRLFESIKLKSDVDLATVSRIEERRSELPGVIVDVEPYRYYPFGALTAPLTGFVGEISLEELGRFPGYKAGEVLGKDGLERAHEELLRGRSGGETVVVDATGRPVEVLGSDEPTPGHNIDLTLDLGLQKVARDALLESMRRVREDPVNPIPEARAGAVVALDPNTGAILALVSEPSYDPNVMISGLTATEWNKLQSDPLKPLLNRALRGEYPPGSTFKMITLLAALEKKVVGFAETLVCTGVYWRIMPKKDWLPEGHGVVDPLKAVQQSCNIAFYEYGYRAGIDALSEMSALFGLGEPTGVRDMGAEKRGTRPSRQWKRNYFTGNPEMQVWYPAETLDAAIGQGFHAYTPLQMAVYTAALANGGIRYRPYLLDRVRTPGGAVVRETKPEVIAEIPVSAKNFEFTRKAMELVTGPGGTAWRAFQDYPVPVAGKTGTAQLSGDKLPHAWFVAFAPAENPRIALAVLVEHGNSGARAAAPVARAILDQFFGFPPPDGGLLASPGTPVEAQESPSEVPEE
ncbi:MAG: penicillin-binding protein 2 [Firmicutes bacterium]|nr:penicillin-binding protein 2 [Bacillota bacterium]